MKVLKGGAAVRTADEPLRWLYRLVDHCCFDVLRRRRRSPETLAPDEGRSRHPGVEIELRDAVMRLLGALDEDQMRIAVLLFVDGMAIAAAHSPGEVTFVFYFSGHGDRDRIHLGLETVAMTDIAARARAVPAGLRLVVTDACRSYPSRFKGATTEPGFAIANPSTNPADGVVWLFASGDGEPAQESDELEGALFTHYWVSSLRGAGDANGDGRVTLAESYDFAYSQTLLRSAGSTGVLQHPAEVLDLRQAAPIVLTQTFASGTIVRLPRAADAHYLVYSLGSRVVLGKLWASAEREVAFAIPAGRYLVQRRSPAGSGALELALAAGEARTLAASDFRPVQEEQLASKGGAVVLRPNEVGIELEGAASRLSSYGGSVGVRYARRLGDWALSVGAAGGYGVQSTGAENVTLESFGLDAIGERRVSLGLFAVGLGAGAEADVLAQNLQRTDAARVALADYPTTQSLTGLACGPVARAHLQLRITPVTWLDLSLRGGALFANVEGGLGALWTARAGLGAGVSF